MPNLSEEPDKRSNIRISYEDPKPFYTTLEHIYQKAYVPVQEYGHQEPDEIRTYLRKVLYNQEGRMIIAWDEHQIVGFAAVECSTTVGEISEIVIDPDYQGLGIGRKLFKYACQVLLKKGCSTLSLAVGVRNYRARRFYEKQGFHSVRYSQTWVDMEKDIKNIKDTSEGSEQIQAQNGQAS